MTYEPAAAAVRELADIMERLRSPGGCPWDARQTPESLAPYLLEETHETLEALSEGDVEAIRDELGDLLLQIVFQARIFEERGDFDLRDVARGIVDKLVRRHPHVFGAAQTTDEEELHRQWERIKGQEQKHRHRSGRLLTGIPKTLPALSRAQKALARLARRNQAALLPDPAWPAGLDRETEEKASLEHQIGERLLDLVELCRRLDLDAETVLRSTLLKLENRAGEPSPGDENFPKTG